MQSKKINIIIYYLILNSILFLIFFSLFNVFTIVKLSLILSTVLMGLINVIFFFNIEKILLFKFVSRENKSYKKLISKINNQCVLFNINKIKIYSSKVLINQFIYIKKSKTDSMLIISDDALSSINNVDKFKTIFDIIQTSTLISTLMTSVNNILFFIIISPIIVVHKKLNFRLFEYLLVMLSNIHFTVHSSHQISSLEFELYAKKRIIDQILLTNIDNSISNVD